MQRVVLSSNSFDKCMSTLIDEYSEIDEIFKNNKIYFIVGRHAYDVVRNKMSAEGITFGINRVTYNKILDMPKCHLGNSIFVFATEDPKVFDPKYKYFMSEEVTEVLKIPKIEYCDRTNAKKYLEYFDSLPSDVELGFDYETNGMPFRTGFEITGFSISSNDYSVWFDYRYPVTPKVDINDEAYTALKWFLDRNQNRLWTFNVSFETKVCYHLFSQYYKLQDTRAVAVCCGLTRGSLKELAQRILKIPSWTDDELLIRAQSAVIMSKFENYDAYLESKKNGFNDKNDNEKASVNRAIELLSKYEIDKDLLGRYWRYEWAIVPEDILGYYCCLDSFYTLCLKQKMYNDSYKRAYECYLANQRLAFELTSSGIIIDERKAKKMYDKLSGAIAKSRLLLDEFLAKYELNKVISRINKEYSPNERMEKFIDKYGSGILNGYLYRFIYNTISSDPVNFIVSEDKLNELFDDSEIGTFLKTFYNNISGKFSIAQLYRKRSFANSINSKVKEYIDYENEVKKYNQYNNNESYKIIKNHVNSKIAKINSEIFDEFNQYKFDKLALSKFVVASKNIEISTQLLNDISKFFDESVPVNARIEIVSKLYKNKDQLNYFINVGPIDDAKEEELMKSPIFVQWMIKYLEVNPNDKDKVDSLYKFFSNYNDYLMSNKLVKDANNYSDIEYEVYLTDDKDKVTLNGVKKDVRSIGNRINYQAPAGKAEILNKIAEYYQNEHRYTLFLFYGINKKYPNVNYDNFEQEYSSNEELRNEINSAKFTGASIQVRTSLAYVFVVNKDHALDYDHVSTSLDSYNGDKLLEYQALLVAYMIQNCLAKEVNTYLSNLLFNSNPIDSKIDGYYIIGNKKPGVPPWEDDRPYCYQPSWLVNMMATKRWSSGWHTFVPGSDTLSNCVFEDDEVGFYFDISQAEVRTTAYLCHDEEMINLYEQGKDVYKEVIKASHPDYDDGRVSAMRASYKSVVLGKLYGRGNRSIADNIGKSLEETNKIISNFFGRFKKINSVIQQKVEFCKEHGYIDTYLGDKIYADKNRAATVGINYFIQNATAVILAEAFNNNLRKQRDLGLTTTIKSVVHDSNIIGVKVKDLFLVIMCCRKYFHDYVMNKYAINYDYDLLIHINLRDKIKIKYDHETSKFSMKGSYDSIQTLMNYLDKYYKYDILSDKITDEGGYNSVFDMSVNWDFRHHKFYSDNDFKVNKKRSVELLIHDIKDYIDARLMEVNND